MKSPSIAIIIFFIIGLISGLVSGAIINVYTTTATISNTITIISTEEKIVTSIVTVTITEKINKTKSPDTSCISFKSSKDAYMISEEVVLVFENNCDYTLVLPNPAPWLITNVDGEIIYSPIVIQVIKEVRPGELITWVWDQRDNMGGQVSTGTYYARLHILNVGMLVTEFKIVGVQRCLPSYE